MDQTTLREVEARCTQEAMPQCAASCPFRMDVRLFMRHMAEGSVNDARKVLERYLPLPEIMARICDAPCESACLREVGVNAQHQSLGGSLAVARLEAACITQAPPQTKHFPRSPKSSRIAVLGNSLAGLVVAYDLARKAYPITLFYEQPAHEVLVQRFPALEEATVQQQWAALEAMGCTFVQRPLNAALLAEAQAGYDAVCLDADAAIAVYESLGVIPDPTTLLVAEHTCAAGMVGKHRAPSTGTAHAQERSASLQAGEARYAALTLERCVTGVSLTAERETWLPKHSPLYTTLAGIAPAAPVVAQGACFTKQEAQQEAARCIRCECLACVKECVYLQKHGSYPRSYARQIYNNASIVKGDHRANALVNGCMLCGQCTELCPERFSMAEVCLIARQDMVNRSFMPASAHEFALEDMQSANSDPCVLFQGAVHGKRCTHVLFPGCQLAGARHEQVLATYDFLQGILPQGAGLGLFSGCCGIPAHWAGQQVLFTETVQRIHQEWQQLEGPTLVVACASCLKVFTEHLPDIPVISLWEVLHTHYRSHPPAQLSGDPVPLAVHDPCAARNNSMWQEAVRGLAVLCGVHVAEAARTRTETACCGYGGLVWCAQPELAGAAARHIAQGLPHAALTSCIMCREQLTASGHEAVHVLDILPCSRDQSFFPQQGAPPQGTPPVLGLSARRAGRAALRRTLLERTGQHVCTPAASLVVVPPALQAELEHKHILLEDVQETVQAVEQSQKRFLEQESGHYVGAWCPRNVTFWVRYSKEENGTLLVHDAWCHRMRVPGVAGKTAVHIPQFKTIA